MLDRCEERQGRNQILIVCFLLNFNGLSGGTLCHNSRELSLAMTGVDASKFPMHCSAGVEFGLGAESWGWWGKLQNDGSQSEVGVSDNVLLKYLMSRSFLGHIY